MRGPGVQFVQFIQSILNVLYVLMGWTPSEGWVPSGAEGSLRRIFEGRGSVRYLFATGAYVDSPV